MYHVLFFVFQQVPTMEAPKNILLVTVLILAILVTGCRSAFLHETCEKNSDCFAELSQCDEAYKVCACRPYSVEYNATTCLPGKLARSL